MIIKKITELNKKEIENTNIYNIACVYCIYCSGNDKVYVGSASNYSKRMGCHKHYLRNNKHHNEHLQRSFNKYSEQNIRYYILESFEEKPTIEHLRQREEYWIEYFQSHIREFGFNFCVKADAMHSKESILKAVKTRSKTKRIVRFPYYGRIVSLETRLKSSKSLKKAYELRGDEIKKKILESRKWYKCSDETKKKLSEINKNDPWRKEHLKRLAENRRNREGTIAEKAAMEKLKEFSKKSFSRKIDKIDKVTNEVIETYNSLTEACSKNNVDFRNVSAAALGKQKTAYGFVWKYTDDGPKLDFAANSPKNREKMRLSNKSKKTVLQCDKDGNILNEFLSISSASIAVNGHRYSISKSCKDHSRMAYGFYWKYKN